MVARVLDTAELRKARGAFFTPPELCDFVAEWAIRSGRDRVLEPSCGEAAFLLAAGARLRGLGLDDVAENQLHGIEIHEESARSAVDLLGLAGFRAHVSTGDFIDCSLAPTFDAVVGNPPYIRYQSFFGEPRTKSQQAALKHGVRLTSLASSWASFVVHASGFLKPDGRLGLVLPAELLTVNYAAPVRRFLLERFARVKLVLFEARVFPGVLEEVVLLLGEGTGPTDHYELYQAQNLGALSDLKPRICAPKRAEEKWIGGLLPPPASEAYEKLTGGGGFCDLLAWGETDLGMVTGNNRFFTLSAARVRDLGLSKTDIIRISPPSSRHLRGLTFTDKAWEEMRDESSPVYLFFPDQKRPSKAALAYIAEGEKLGVEKAYKCRVRSPWWRVPTVGVADLFVTYMNHDTPRLVANRARVPHLNSVHGLTLKADRRGVGMDLLPLAMLNSLTLLGAELVGRSYGGGILKVEPREADRLPVPTLETIQAIDADLRALRPVIGKQLRSGGLLKAVRMIDRLLLRRQMKVGTEELSEVRKAREALFARRTARAGKMSGGQSD